MIVLGAGKGKTNVKTPGADCFYLKCSTDQRIEIGLMSLSSTSNQQGFGVTMDNSGTLLNSIVIRDVDFKDSFRRSRTGRSATAPGSASVRDVHFGTAKFPPGIRVFKIHEPAGLWQCSFTGLGHRSVYGGRRLYLHARPDAWEFYLSDTDGPCNAMFRHNQININHSGGWTESGHDMHGNNDGGRENAFRNGYGIVMHHNVFTLQGGAQLDKLADIRGGVGTLVFQNTVTGSSFRRACET